MGFDPEAIYQDADIEMAEAAEAGEILPPPECVNAGCTTMQYAGGPTCRECLRAEMERYLR